MQKRSFENKKTASKSSWEPVKGWYNEIVGKEGHYYHQKTVMPGVLNLLDLKDSSSLLDLGCGQGVLARAIPKGVSYTGVDASKGLIENAKKQTKRKDTQFIHADATGKIPLNPKSFTHAAIILALQNMDNPEAALKNAAELLTTNGRLVIVLNHPCFRIARQSGWGVDEKQKQQYRRVTRYMSNLEIPIQANPSLGNKSPMTTSYHYPLNRLIKALIDAGLVVTALDEWCSDKESTGKAAKMENRARNEIPLFMAIRAEKKC